MDNNFTYHVGLFNDRVRAMNQSNRTEVRLTATEANNLLSDIVSLTTQIARLEAQNAPEQDTVVEVFMDGGSFK